MSDVDSTQLRYLGVEASDAQIKRTMNDPDAMICEWPTSGLTFVGSQKELVIVRAGALGGDTKVIHGGWKYLGLLSFWKEWGEIRDLEPSFTRKRKT